MDEYNEVHLTEVAGNLVEIDGFEVEFVIRFQGVVFMNMRLYLAPAITAVQRQLSI